MPDYASSGYLADFVLCTSSFAKQVTEDLESRLNGTSPEFGTTAWFQNIYNKIRAQFTDEQRKKLEALLTSDDPRLAELNRIAFEIHNEIMYQDDRLSQLQKEFDAQLT